MQEYIKTLLLAGGISALASLLMPEKNDRLRRAIEFGLALFLLVVICRPLATVGDWSQLLGEWQYPSTDGITAPGYTDETWAKMEESVASGVVMDIADRYRLSPREVQATLSLQLEGDELSISSLTLHFSGAARTADLYAIRAYAQKTYTPNCEVKIDGG